MENYCVIFGSNGDVAPRERFDGKDGLILATVGGFYNAVGHGVLPDAVVGDFKDGETLDTDEFVVKIERDKADSALFAAVKVGLRRGCKTFVIYGMSGGLAPTAESFSALAYLDAHGARGFLIGGETIATVFSDGSFTLPKTAVGAVSIFAYGGAADGVTAKGFDGAAVPSALTAEQPPLPTIIAAGSKRGATVSVKRGALLVVFGR